MRNLSVTSDTIPGCCGVQVLFGFPYVFYDTMDPSGDEGSFVENTKPITNEEWFTLLAEQGYIRTSFACIFIHSREENTGVCTPKKLAEWLKGKGEKVRAINSISGGDRFEEFSANHLTTYIWVPTKSFVKKFDNFKNKQLKEQQKNATKRGARAA